MPNIFGGGVIFGADCDAVLCQLSLTCLARGLRPECRGVRAVLVGTTPSPVYALVAMLRPAELSGLPLLAH